MFSVCVAMVQKGGDAGSSKSYDHGGPSLKLRHSPRSPGGGLKPCGPVIIDETNNKVF